MFEDLDLKTTESNEKPSGDIILKTPSTCSRVFCSSTDPKFCC